MSDDARAGNEYTLTVPIAVVAQKGRHLVVFLPTGPLSLPLPAQTVVVGRGQDAAVRVDHPSLSRQHVRLERRCAASASPRPPTFRLAKCFASATSRRLSRT
jgi:hypothetical protein